MLPLLEAPTPVEPIQCQKPLGEATGCPGSSRAEERGGTGSQVVKSCLHVTIVMRESGRVDYSRVWFYLG
jgi:hypothetical protein